MAQKTDYAAKLGEMSALATRSAGIIRDRMIRVSPTNVAQAALRCDALHKQATEQNVQLFDRLYHDFITPIERDDMARLGQGLCRLTGDIGAIISDMDRYGMTDVPTALQTAIGQLYANCEQWERLLTAFWQFRKDNAWWKIQQTFCRDVERGIAVCRDETAAVYTYTDDPSMRQIRQQLYTDVAECFRDMAQLADTVSIAVLKNI